jgi:hypothetical protein
MTPTERLILQALAVNLELSLVNAKALGAYHDNRPKLVLEQIEATLDSATADEVDALK